MGHPQPPCTACARAQHPHRKQFPPIIKSKPALFQYEPIPPCPVTTVPDRVLSCFPVAPSYSGKVLGGLHTTFPSLKSPNFSAFPHREVYLRNSVASSGAPTAPRPSPVGFPELQAALGVLRGEERQGPLTALTAVG